MSKPYNRSDRSKKKTRDRSPAHDTQSLVESLPASLRFLNSGSTHSSSKMNEDKAKEDIDEDESEKDESEKEESTKADKDEDYQNDDDDEVQNDEEPISDDDEAPGGTNPQRRHSRGSSVNRSEDLFRTADPSVSSVNLPMAPENRAKWEQVADIFELDPKHRAQALRLSSITGDDNRFYALVCLQQLARQEVSNESSRRYTDWTPKSTFAEQLKKIIRRTLRDSSIESYTETLDSNKVLIQGSFHRKALQGIMEKSDSWKADYLPADFGTTLDDLSDHEKFIEFFKGKLRHARDDFRLIILKDIYVPQSKIKVKEPQTEVQDLGSLLVHLYQFFDPNESRTETELKRAVDAKTQARLAYLRMEIAIYHNTSDEKRKENGGLSYWRLIDRKLAQLRDQSRDYRRAFNAIILARDQGLFNGKNKWDQIKTNDKFEVPTEEDVLMAIRTLPSNAA